MIVVSDAGPLIYLGSVGRLALLRDLFGRVVVLRQVWNEVVGGLLLRGKRMGLLDAVGPTLSARIALGLRVSRELVDATLELAGEK